MSSLAVTPLVHSLVLENSQRGELLPHLHGCLSILVKINIYLAMSFPMLKPSSALQSWNKGSPYQYRKGCNISERKEKFGWTPSKWRCLEASSSAAIYMEEGFRTLPCIAQPKREWMEPRRRCSQVYTSHYATGIGIMRTTGILWVHTKGILLCCKALQMNSLVFKFLQSLSMWGVMQKHTRYRLETLF